MTRRNLRNRIKLIVFLCLALATAGGALYYFDNSLFQVFKDLILLLVAIPAAFLADYFQKRSQFEDALRVLWSHILDAVNEARQYTLRTSATEEEFGKVLIDLRKSIDEVRSVYRNLGETKHLTGFYPFESLKLIYASVHALGYGTLDPKSSAQSRTRIEHYWTNFKESFLWEFDRPEPDFYNSPHIYKRNEENTFEWAVLRKEEINLNGRKIEVSLVDKFDGIRIVVSEGPIKHDFGSTAELDQDLSSQVRATVEKWELDGETKSRVNSILTKKHPTIGQ